MITLWWWWWTCKTHEPPLREFCARHFPTCPSTGSPSDRCSSQAGMIRDTGGDGNSDTDSHDAHDNWSQTWRYLMACSLFPVKQWMTHGGRRSTNLSDNYLDSSSWSLLSACHVMISNHWLPYQVIRWPPFKDADHLRVSVALVQEKRFSQFTSK